MMMKRECTGKEKGRYNIRYGESILMTYLISVHSSFIVSYDDYYFYFQTLDPESSAISSLADTKF